MASIDSTLFKSKQIVFPKLWIISLTNQMASQGTEPLRLLSQVVFPGLWFDSRHGSSKKETYDSKSTHDSSLRCTRVRTFLHFFILFALEWPFQNYKCIWMTAYFIKMILYSNRKSSSFPSHLFKSRLRCFSQELIQFNPWLKRLLYITIQRFKSTHGLNCK